MGQKPFIKLFQSPKAFYFFDVNQNKIMNISKSTYDILDKWLSGEKNYVQNNVELEKLIKNGYLSPKRPSKIEHPLTNIVEPLLDSKLNMLILQLTQKCNFRCSYCVYSSLHSEGQRVHSAKTMSLETAMQAVDFFAEHSIDSNIVYISFYGGEPLLNFDLLKKIVPYIQHVFKGKRLSFGMTTNGSLLSPEIVRFLVTNKIYFMLSLDGPEKIHNINRRMAINGKGSFQLIKKNMNYIKETYPEYFEKLSISMVIDQQNDYDYIREIYRDELFGEIREYNVSYIDDKYSLEKTVYTEEYTEREVYHHFVTFWDYITQNNLWRKDQDIQRNYKNLYSFLEQLDLSEGLPETGVPSGPCVAGKTKLFINTDGNFYPCEKVSELSSSMCIGNLKNGFNYSAVKNLLNIAQLTSEECKNCWAFAHCFLCATYCDDHGELSGDLRKSFCRGVQKELEEKILDYIALIECKELLYRD